MGACSHPRAQEEPGWRWEHAEGRTPAWRGREQWQGEESVAGEGRGV